MGPKVLTTVKLIIRSKTLFGIILHNYIQWATTSSFAQWKTKHCSLIVRNRNRLTPSQLFQIDSHMVRLWSSPFPLKRIKAMHLPEVEMEEIHQTAVSAEWRIKRGLKRPFSTSSKRTPYAKRPRRGTECLLGN